MTRLGSYLRRTLGLAMVLALFTAGCGDDSSSSEVPDAARTDGGPGSDARSPIDATPVDADPNAPDASPESCGGFTGKQCEGKTYCDYPDNSCGNADATGACLRRPDLCQPVVQPVCGCDGMEYSNECEAYLAGTDVASQGGC